MPAGNRIPLFGPKMGCRFPLDPLRETASHFKGVNRDVISPNGTFGKPHSRRTKRDELSHGDPRPEACPIARPGQEQQGKRHANLDERLLQFEAAGPYGRVNHP